MPLRSCRCPKGADRRFGRHRRTPQRGFLDDVGRYYASEKLSPVPHASAFRTALRLGEPRSKRVITLVATVLSEPSGERHSGARPTPGARSNLFSTPLVPGKRAQLRPIERWDYSQDARGRASQDRLGRRRLVRFLFPAPLQ
jgi:hypothetical protein